MGKNRLFAAGAAALAATMVLSACGTRTAETPEGGPSGGAENKTAKIGVIAPLTGDLSPLGVGIKNSVDLAVKQANESNAVPGWTLELAAEDDEAKPDTGKNAATKLTSDPKVVGIVGPLNSSVGQVIQPVIDSAGIAEISPANTNPTLTRGAKPVEDPQRTYDTYFRTCTTDDVQGPFAAKYLLDEGIKKVGTIHDKKTYGQGLVDAFAKYYKENGGEIVAAETINPEDKDFSAVISKVKGAKPEAVYYGGEFPQAGPLSQQMKAGGLKVPLMGGDGIYDGNFIKLAGKDSDGDLATSVGAPTETLESAKQFVDAYAAAGYPEEYAAYGAYAYDAANALIEALKTSTKDAADAEATRSGTVEALANVSFDGATGPVAFDEYGDTLTKVLTVYKVTDGKWKADKTGEFKG